MTCSWTQREQACFAAIFTDASGPRSSRGRSPPPTPNHIPRVLDFSPQPDLPMHSLEHPTYHVFRLGRRPCYLLSAVGYVARITYRCSMTRNGEIRRRVKIRSATTAWRIAIRGSRRQNDPFSHPLKALKSLDAWPPACPRDRGALLCPSNTHGARYPTVADIPLSEIKREPGERMSLFALPLRDL